jgi:hypothetical protein
MVMTEFDERGNKYTGNEALKRKLTYEFMVESGEIPFSSFGSKIDPFNLNNRAAWQITDTLAKYGVVSSFVLQQGRLSLVEASIVVDLSGGIKQQALNG